MRDAFKHLGTDLTDYKFFKKLLSLFCVRIRGEEISSGRGSFAPLLDILRETAQAQLSGLGSEQAGNLFSEQSISLTKPPCPYCFEFIDKDTVFCNAPQLKVFGTKETARRYAIAPKASYVFIGEYKRKIPVRLCWEHWNRYLKEPFEKLRAEGEKTT